MFETHKRSIIKAITWRIAAFIITAVVAFLFTKEAILSLSIGLSDSAVKIVSYYLHERAWNKIKFGKEA